MPQPQGEELARVRARREELRERYLGRSDAAADHRGRDPPPGPDLPGHRGDDQVLPGVPRVPAGRADREPGLRGSNHFFFDIGDGNLLGFFDFPGFEHPAWQETIGGVQHLAISVTAEQFDAARKKLEQAGTDYLGPDRGADNSMYFRDPNGVGLELYREDLGKFEGQPLI